MIFAAAVALLFYISAAKAPSYEALSGRQLCIAGEVCQKEYRNGTAILYLKDIKWQSSANVPQKVMCYMETSERTAPKLGSRIQVQGRLQEWEEATNPGEFDQKKYYRIFDLDFMLQDAVLLRKGVSYSRYRETLYLMKRSMETIFDSVLEAEDASVMKAVLLGNKAELDGEIKELYTEAGISHILAISGLHISLIGMGFYRLFKRLPLPRVTSVLLTAFFLYSYGVMTGMGTSVCRAVLMFLLWLFAGFAGRTYDMLTAVALTGVLLLAEQPLYLTYPGFLLSFSAVLGIALFAPVLKKAQLSVFLSMLPIQLMCFHEVSVLSILLNLLILPLMPLLAGIGLMIPALFQVSARAAEQAGTLCSVILNFYEKMSRLSGSIPGSVWRVGMPYAAQFLMYGILLLILIRHGRHFSARLIGIWILSAVFILTNPVPVPGIQITMIDVGQGDGFLIRSADTVILIDGGSSSKKEVGKYQMLPVLKYFGIAKIDYLFFSHMDEDHCNGTRKLLEEEKITCSHMIVPAAAGYEEEYPSLQKLLQDGTLYRMKQGDRIKTETLEIDCLYPGSSVSFTDANSTSLVLQVTSGEFTALFTGDIGEKEEALVLPLLRKEGYTLLKAAHHGSNGGCSDSFLDRVRPQLTFLSCGRNNPYGHPGKQTMERLTKRDTLILSTAQKGAVTIYVKNNAIRFFCGAKCGMLF